MSLLKFLFYRKKEQSVLGAKKYGTKKVSPEKLDESLLAKRKYGEKNKQEKGL